MNPLRCLVAAVALVAPTVLPAPAAAQRTGEGTAASRPAPGTRGGPVLALAHANLVDGTGADPKQDVTILVRDGRIQAVYASAERELPDSASVVDLSGRWVIPGLIDAHVHITGGSGDYRHYEELLRGLLRSGVTGVRDMAGDARILGYLAREAELDTVPFPRVYYSALMAGPTFFRDDPRVPGAARGWLNGNAPWMRSIDGETDVDLAVAEARGTGATALKLYANLPAATVAGLTAAAHREGLLVWAHATVFPARPMEEVRAGVDVLSHTPYLVWQAEPRTPLSYASRARADFTRVKPDDPRIVAVLDSMRAHGTILDATLRVFATETEEAPDAVGPGIAPWSYAVTRLAHERGVLVDAGTDSNGLHASKDGYDLDAGPTVVDEMALLVEKSGFSPLEAIHAATQVNAMTVGRAAERGAVTPGLAADLLVLSADPTADVRNATKVVTVYKDGRKVR